MELEGKQIRVGIIGSPCIGKTCIVKRFVENTFHGSVYNPTPGVDFFARRMSIKPVGTVTFIIEDIGSNALSSKMLPIYLNGIEIFLLTYDMTNSSSLADLRKWITIITAFSDRNKNSDPSFALVGSKGDLEHLRSIRLDGHTRFAQEHGIPLSFLVSAKSGESVIACFTRSVIYHLSPEAKQRTRDSISLQASVPSVKRGSIAIPSHVSHPHPMFHPPPSSSTSGHQGHGRSNQQQDQDPNSSVCSLQ